MTTTQRDKAAEFLDLHRPGAPLLLPNPWDQGSARLLASLGFRALATTSSGYAASLGRLDGSVSRDEAMPPSSWRRPTCPSPRTWRIASPTIWMGSRGPLPLPCRQAW